MERAIREAINLLLEALEKASTEPEKAIRKVVEAINALESLLKEKAGGTHPSTGPGP